MKNILLFGVGITLFFFAFNKSAVFSQIQPVRVNPLRTAASTNNTKSGTNKLPISATVPASGTITTVSGTVPKNDSSDNNINPIIIHATTPSNNNSDTNTTHHNLKDNSNTNTNTKTNSHLFGDAVTSSSSLSTPEIGEPQPLKATSSKPNSLNTADPFISGTSSFPANVPNTSPTASGSNAGNNSADNIFHSPTELSPIPTYNTPPDTLPEINIPKISTSDNIDGTYSTHAEVVKAEGTGSPGPIGLEGTQTPHVTIEKVLPTEIIIEQPATIKTVIRNVGRSTAKNVTIKDRIPQGTRLLSTVPKANMTPEGELIWELGNLDGSEQVIVEMRIIPVREGEIGSIAVVNYHAEASSRAMVTRPKIHVEVKAPQEIKLGETANLEITISNPGTATTTGIILEEYIPEGLYHKDGKVLRNKNIDALKPKEAKKLTLPLKCVGAGVLQNRLVVKANGNLKAEEKTIINALAPILDLKIVGAKQRFLERKSDFKLIISNAGTASAQGVDLKLSLPASMQFVSTNQSGVYEPATHTVHWALEELPAEAVGEIDLILMPAKIGNYTLKFTGNGKNNLHADAEHAVVIDGISAISFEIAGDSNLVEMGKDAIYEIKVANKGTKSAGNVRVNAQLSNGMSFVNADGPVRHQSKNGIVQFEPLGQLDAKGEKVYKIAARCDADGDHRITVQIISDDLEKPITKEESTRVFR
ncbi:MAG: DUF11 domain-containing protein [Planctomycetaceae bacterium]|jgi:uncharacterized repeat protein (TIGR01451 family)|nr:DUF11 domain-containing protein [Planctomycetaceae bacterium]